MIDTDNKLPTFELLYRILVKVNEKIIFLVLFSGTELRLVLQFRL